MINRAQSGTTAGYDEFRKKIGPLMPHKRCKRPLKQYGMKGETYNDILKRLMDEVDYDSFMERQYKKLEENEKLLSLDEV